MSFQSLAQMAFSVHNSYKAHVCSPHNRHTPCAVHRTVTSCFFDLYQTDPRAWEFCRESEGKGRKMGSRHVFGKAPEELQIQTSSIFKSLSISIFTYWATPRNNTSCAFIGSHMDHKVLHSHRSGTSVLARMHHFGTTMMVKHVRRDMAETTNGVSHCLKPAWTLKNHLTTQSSSLTEVL